MAAVAPGIGVAVQASLTTALQRINPAGGARVVWINSDVDIFLVYDDSLDDAGVVPATARFRIPAGTSWPAEVLGKRMHIAAVTGTGTAYLLGAS